MSCPYGQKCERDTVSKSAKGTQACSRDLAQKIDVALSKTGELAADVQAAGRAVDGSGQKFEDLDATRLR